MTANQTWLYHEICRRGGIFNSEDIEKLVQGGWVDTPAKLSQIKEVEKIVVKDETIKSTGVPPIGESAVDIGKPVENKETDMPVKRKAGRPRKEI